MKINIIQEKYQKLNTQDRRAVSILGIFLSLCVLLFGIIKPSYEYRKVGKSDFETSMTNHTWISKALQNINNAPAEQDSSNSKAISGNPIDAINKIVNHHGIAIKRMQSSGDKAITLWLENVEFNKAISAIYEIASARNVTLKDFSLNNDISKQSGIVNIRLALSLN